MKPFLVKHHTTISWLRRRAGQLGLCYAFVSALLFVAQRHLLYHPTGLSPAEFTTQVHERFGGKARILTGFDAVVLEPAAPAVATAILFHGNGGNGIDRAVLASRFLARGYRLILAEYPGYAARGGAPSESVIAADALQLYSAVHRLFPGQPVTLVGESLGSGVAVQVAANAAARPPAAVVLITPFASMTEVAQSRFPALPVALLLQDRYDSARHIRAYHGPVRIMVADRDELVGAASGLALYQVAAARGEALLVRSPSAGHNDWWSRLTSPQWSELLGPALSGPEAAARR